MQLRRENVLNKKIGASSVPAPIKLYQIYIMSANPFFIIPKLLVLIFISLLSNYSVPNGLPVFNARL